MSDCTLCPGLEYFDSLLPCDYFPELYWEVAVCPLVYDSLGRQRIGIEQPQAGSIYPFVTDPAGLSTAIADLYLAYSDNASLLVHPFRIDWLAGFGCGVAEGTPPADIVHCYELQISDALGQVVFDTRQAESFRIVPWTSRLNIAEWSLGEIVLRVVIFLTWRSGDTPNDLPFYLEPVAATLAERTIEQIPPRLRSLTIDDLTFQGPLKLVNGFNTDLTVGATSQLDGQRRRTGVSFDAAPGDGSGRYSPGCVENAIPAIRFIGGVGGDAQGRFNLDATGCYRIQQPVAVRVATSPPRVQLRAAALQLTNDCGPCYTCDDFVAVYEAIRKLRDRTASVLTAAQAARDKLTATIAAMEKSQSCRNVNRLQLLLRPECEGEISVAASYCNTSDQCLRNLVLILSFNYAATLPCASPSGRPLAAATTTASDPTAVNVLCGTAFRSGETVASRQGKYLRTQQEQNAPYQLGGAYPYFWAIWRNVQPGAAAQVSFRLQFPVVAAGDTAQVVAEAYSVPQLTPGGGAPIPNYVLGAGPQTAGAVGLRVYPCGVFGAAPISSTLCCGQSGTGDTWAETPTGTVDGSNQTFALSSPPVSGNLMLFRNGLLQEQGLDYTLSGSTITFLLPGIPLVGDTILATYQSGA